VDALVLPNARNPAAVWDVHRRRRARLRKVDNETMPLPGDDGWIDEMLKEHARTMDHMVAAGYYMLDDDAGVYRKTWKGAYLMTWKLLPPVKQVRQLMKRIRAGIEVRRLGVDLAVLRKASMECPTLSTGAVN
jgi:hypothetical protein